MINICNCIGCRKGISLFLKKDDQFFHLDFFATPEAGVHFPCANSPEVGNYLIAKNDDDFMFTPNEELSEIYDKESDWFEDIVTLVQNCFYQDQEQVNGFFMEENNGIKRWQKSNEDLEEDVLVLAITHGIKPTKEDYPDLLINQNK